jgi:hypothetical protein
MSDRTMRVMVEATRSKTFASALDWPGLSRAGKDEALAIEALAAAIPRYAPVARAAGAPFAEDGWSIEVTERLEGDATTAFGAPSRVAEADRRPTTADEASALAALVEAAWAVLDATAEAAPAELRKGPRGGGRDTAKVVEHVQGAHEGYAGVMAIPPASRRPEATVRAAMLAVLREPSDGSPIGGRKWPPRYAARRVAWHALDHAWEIEDRSEPAARG